MYKTKLPFLIVFNKIDVASHEFALRWMDDLDEFQVCRCRADSNQHRTCNRLRSSRTRRIWAR